MDHYPITIHSDSEVITYEVRDYPLDESERCQFEIYSAGKLIVSFRPDNKGILHICSNPEKLGNEILHAIAEEIEKVNF